MLDAFVRWIHVGAAVLWVGMAFAGKQIAFFRWASLVTWVSGLLLIGLVYHLGGLMVGADATSRDRMFAFAGSQACIFFGFFPYHFLWKWVRSPLVAAALSLALFTGVAFALSRVMAGRALWLHLGAILGTVMLLNLWMRIWREKPDAPQRRVHNLTLAFPVLFFMVTPHTFAVGYGDDLNWAWAAVVLVVGGAASHAVQYKLKA